MAKILRDGECFWIDTTEVTEDQFAQYLATKPMPSDDPRCTGPPDPSIPCQDRASADGGRPDPQWPKTCVDWCAARDFCIWAGKELCHDNLGAVGRDQLLLESDFYAACTESGKEPFPLGADCGSQVCNVDNPTPAGKVTSCFTRAADGETPVYDLIGNAEEWTEWCFSAEPNAVCAIRGSSYRSTRAHKCCEQLSQLERRKALITVGFRCCAYP
jgi:formylglycine-generating enzyme required for sulfatase activity